MTSQDPITSRARELFDRASEGLDQGAAFRLRRARQEAQQGPARPRASRNLMPAGAFAAAVLALGLAWWLPPGSTQPAPASSGLASNAEIEALLADEDPELYDWLADAPVATRPPGPRL
jgi:ferric-dicitrate binding protein FerR (iron transport regulator)